MAVNILYLSPDSHDFGTKELNSETTQNFTLLAGAGNPDTVAATVAVSGSGASHFSITAGAAGGLAPGASRSVTVKFKPTALGAKSASLNASGTAPSGVTGDNSSLSGTGGSSTYTLTIGPKRAKGGDNFKVTMVFTRNDGGFWTSENASDGDTKKVKLLKLGSLSWDFDLDELWLMVGTWDLTLGDYDDFLLAKFFNENGVDRRPSVKLEVQHQAAGSYVLEFLGNVTEDGVDLENGLAGKIMKILILPMTDVLNRSSLYEQDGTAINPLGRSVGAYSHVKTLIEDVFQVVDPAISVSIVQPWIWKGQYASSPWKDDIVFDEIFQLSNELFFSSGYGLGNLGDVLRKLAVDYGCIAGFVHSQKAFFHPLYRTQPSNKFTPTGIMEDRWLRSQRIIKYVKVISALGSATEWISEQPDAQAFVTAAEDKIERDSLYYFKGSGASGDTNVRGYRVGFEGAGGYVDVYLAKDTTASPAFSDSAVHLATFWYYYRGSEDRNKIRLVRFRGLNQGPDKMMEYDSGNYVILKMTKDLEESRTEVEGLKI